ncbi:receptor-transporting protein 5 [Diceros bicornis minor]|uniref:3CxxC-type domain-containing protein n=1 Tax=Diceros bicornis minor TaxID=77932 RepID=A0A7J7F0J7_DICBM|nr:receptor-transporting protein 5 [Diceros bicornis minor]KAF5921545.1 hypothetical protein HPG69_009113 [Diceros bicornis minor]
MDGVDVWASTLAQLMTKRKPQDTWELLPEENLASGHLDSSGFQYRLRGLSRLQCGRCQWGWSSAHVHILFHMWWDEDSRLGLVKMRIWGQRCRLCPPGAQRDCQVSLLNVRLFLNKLVLFILQKCYRETLSSDQCPEICFSERCEACDLGVCFFQKPPDPAWGPEVKSPIPIKGRYALYGSSSAVTAEKQSLTLRSSPSGERSWGYTPNSICTPLSVSDFIRNPSESSNFFSEDEDIVTIPFSLLGLGREKGTVTDAKGCVLPREGSLPAADRRGPLIIGKGSIYLPTRSTATPKGRGLPVDIRAPVFQGRGLLTSSIKPFEIKGFIFKGRGSLSSPAGVDEGQGPVSASNGPITAGNDSRPVSYIFGLMDDGEGSVTVPPSLIDTIRGEDSFADIDGCVSFPFVFTDQGTGKDSSTNITEGKGKEDGDNGPVTAAHEPLPGTNIPISKGSITIPFSVFSIIERRDPGYMASGPQSSGLTACGSSKHRRQQQSRLGESGSGSSGDQDICCGDGCCRPHFDPPRGSLDLGLHDGLHPLDHVPV